ncbi:MAG: hypothetical protein ACRYFL_07940, partial [Janthinobacterium lividum]
MNIQFTGEHLFPGQLGQIFIVLAFGSALFSAISYYFATVNKNQLDNSWKQFARYGYFINTL